MKIRAVTVFTVEYATKETCDQFSKPYGTLEVLDADGDRYTFAPNLDAAKGAILELTNADTLETEEDTP